MSSSTDKATSKGATRNPIAAGEVVALKSGSPRMTVTKIINDHAQVLWSDFDTKAICREEFPLIALVRAQ